MAQRRMFSKTIINSGQFIKLPQSSQLLYFYLVLNADDDGVVEAFPIMRLIASSEDDLKILVVKKFAYVLNDDLVTYINDWQEHNLIRADRKIDSKYKNLLLSMIPTVKLLEPTQRADRVESTKENDLGRPADVQMSAQDRLGKDRLGKEKEKDSCASHDEKKEQEKIPYEEIRKLYNDTLPLQTMCKIMTDERKRKIKARWHGELKTLEDWKKYFARVARSDFLCGRTKRPFWADFDWLICPRNCVKVLEDKYNNLRFEEK